MAKEKTRCTWCLRSAEETHYHDTEWGVPLYDDQRLFEFMILDAFQAGLSWTTVLRKRENFRKAFDDFDAGKIARYNEKKIARLLADEGIIRNKLKIYASITNAQKFLEIQDRESGFSGYIWQFTGGKPRVNQWEEMKQIPAKTRESDAMSKALTKEGFKFVGSTICYAFMQAAGMVNDHIVSCYRHKEILKMR